MNIVYCLDENYRKYAEKSIKSVLKYNPQAKITIVSVNQMDVMGLPNFNIPLYGGFRRRGSNDRISDTAYLKLFLTNLPDSYKKIIFLDADVICQRPLNALENFDCEYIGICESHSYGKEQAQDLGLEKYGITGMMVMNLENLRKIDFTKRCLAVMNRVNPKLWCHDETCINVAMKNKMTFLPQTFNYCHDRTYEKPLDEHKVHILHYVGKHKENMLGLPDYENLDPIKNMIKGKSVAIVGNAESIFSKHSGAKIDSNDVVIRFNKGFIKKPNSQGTRTDILFCGTNMSRDEINYYNAKVSINRSTRYLNPVNYTVNIYDRHKLRDMIGAQPSTGFMAIDMCLSMGASKIQLFGFDFEATPTFYNPSDYKTQHDYATERAIVCEYQSYGLLTIK